MYMIQRRHPDLKTKDCIGARRFLTMRKRSMRNSLNLWWPFCEEKDTPQLPKQQAKVEAEEQQQAFAFHGGDLKDR
jgi:hypothetical protein